MYEVVYDVKLHEDYAGGPLKRFPVYEFDYDTMKHDLPGAFRTLASCTNAIIDVGTGDSALRYQKFYVESNQIKNYISANIPVQTSQYGIPENVSGAICPVNTNQPRSHDDPEHTFNFAGYGMVRQESTPVDLNVNPHYIHGAIDDQYGTYSASFRPVFPYTIIDSWTADTQQILNYHDAEHVMCKVLYTGVDSCHFSVWKYESIPWGSSNDYRPQMLGVGFPPNKQMNWSDMDSRMKTYYGICNKDNICLYDLDIQGKNDGTAAFYTGGTTTTESDWTNANKYQFFVHYTVQGEEMFGIAVCYYNKDWDNDIYPTEMYVLGLGTTFWGDSIVAHTEDPSEWGENNQPSTNEGTFSGRSDNVTRDGTDPNSAVAIVTAVNNSISSLFASGGVYTIYKISTLIGYSNLLNIINALYSEYYWTTRWTNKYFNPMSAVLNMGLIPNDFAEVEPDMPIVELILGGENVSEIIKDHTSGVITNPTFNTYRPLAHKSFPTIDLEKFFGGWGDYQPYTKMVLHLPFIGTIQLKTNEFAHGKIGVEYVCDRTNGNVVAYVWANNNSGANGAEISQYVTTANGNCMYSIPLYASSSDYSGAGRILSSLVTAATGAATGNIGAAAGGAAGIVSGAFDLATSPFETHVSGQLGGNNCIMSPKDVWLEVIRPHWVQNMHYKMLNGIPAEMSNCIANNSQNADETGIPYDGYLEVDSIELDGVNCTDSERSEIEALLKAGVWIRGDEILAD